MSDDRPDDFDYGEQRADGQFERYPTIDEGGSSRRPAPRSSTSCAGPRRR